MSDVVAAALIAGGAGVAGTVATMVVALVTTKRQTAADAARLRDEHREADRRVRRNAYALLLSALEQLDMLTSAYTAAPTREAFEAWLSDFRAAGVGVRLVESDDVSAARARLGGVLDVLAERAMSRAESGVPMEDALGVPYVQMREQIHDAARSLGMAMRNDLAFTAE